MKEKTTSGVVALQYISELKKSQSREFRKNPTETENIFWQAVRNRRIGGLKFRRQQVIEGFIVDFFCEEKKLVVEIDGSFHNTEEQKKIDAHRKAVFEARGLREIRFTNEQVFNDLESILDTLRNV